MWRTAPHHKSPHGLFSIRCVPMGPTVTYPWRLQFTIKSPLCPFSIRRVPMGPFSIRPVPVGPAVTHLRRLQFVIKVFSRPFLHPTCNCGTLLYPTGGTRWLTCHVYLWDISLSPSNLWTRRCTCGTFLHLHPTCGTWCRVLVGPFFIRPIGPDGLRVLTVVNHKPLIYSTYTFNFITKHRYRVLN
jgi:hypothetical protein